MVSGIEAALLKQPPMNIYYFQEMPPFGKSSRVTLTPPTSSPTLYWSQHCRASLSTSPIASSLPKLFSRFSQARNTFRRSPTVAAVQSQYTVQ